MLSLIIPTYNEKNNILLLIQKVRETLAQLPYEIIVVDDDSPDGTWQSVAEVTSANLPVRLIRRTNERGLSSAVLHGFREARGSQLAVMDADHSHDVRLLPKMHQLIDQGEADCVVGSRRVHGGGADKWPWHRKLYSEFATLFARTFTGISVRDPMSGFFCIRREIFENAENQLKPKGYKVLLEILVKSKPKRLVELPYIFIDRKQDQSKLSLKVIFEFGSQLMDLLVYRLSQQQECLSYDKNHVF